MKRAPKLPEAEARIVVCPDCKALPGAPCRKPSGGSCGAHAPRRRLAAQAMHALDSSAHATNTVKA